MALLFFCIPVFHSQPAQDELNQCLSTQRVVRVERQWLADGERSCWAVCVETASGPGPLHDSLTAGGRASAGRRDEASAAKVKVDYREVLNAEDFAVYSQLRALRKQLSDRDGVPPYTVLNNDQLAALVQRRVSSVTAFGQIDGIGPARVERYAEQFLPVLQSAWVATAPAAAAE